MDTKKTLAESTNEVLKSRMSATAKAQALIKLGVTPYEAMVLAKSSIPVRAATQRFSYTFGVEIECLHCEPQAFMQAASEVGIAAVNQLNQYNHHDIDMFKLVPDGSLHGIDPAECVTPAMKGTTTGFGYLKKCCRALKMVGATVNRSCGLHVHIGAADLTEQEYCNVFLNYQRLEQAIDSFMANSRRANNAFYAATLRNHILADCHTRSDVYEELSGNRYHKVNPCAWQRHKTIEFRQHQGTTDFAKIQSWVSFLGKLVKYSKDNRLENDVTRIEDIPFLTAAEKDYFIARRTYLNN